MERTAHEVAESAGGRSRERCGVEKHDAAAGGKRIDASHDIGATHVSGSASAERVDDSRSSRSSRSEEFAGRVDPHDVRPDDFDVNGQAGARTVDAAHLPAAQHGLARPAEVAQPALTAPEGELVQEAQIEQLSDIKVVIAAIIIEIERIARGLRFVGS